MTRVTLPERIEAERLLLRVRTVADAEDIHAYASLPEVAYPAAFHPVKTLEDEIIIWSTFFPSAMKRTISQLVTELSSKGLIESSALLISLVVTRMMSWRFWLHLAPRLLG